MRVLALAVVIAGANAGCGEDDCCAFRDAAIVGPDAGLPYDELVRFPVTVNRDLDVLFVIDDSIGGLEQQTALKESFPDFINVLNTIEGGLPNIHLGVHGPANAGRGGAANTTRRRYRGARSVALVLGGEARGSGRANGSLREPDAAPGSRQRLRCELHDGDHRHREATTAHGR